MQNRYEQTQTVCDSTCWIPDGAFVSTPEWKAVRRFRNPHPRRFSKSFIESELKERNEYRRAVRLLQQKPELMDQLDFPFDVPAPIQANRKVSAIDWRKNHPKVREGTVLSCDPDRGTCFIQFDGQALSEIVLCPDSEVRAHSKPEVSMEENSSEHDLDEENLFEPRGKNLALLLHRSFTCSIRWDVLKLSNLCNPRARSNADVPRTTRAW